MNTLTKITLLNSLLIVSLGVVPPAVADQGEGMPMMHHGGGMNMMRHGGGWKSTLTDDQQKKIARLKLDYKKKKYPLKAKIKQAKIELALLIISNKPSEKAISKKIDQIVKLKSEKLHLKAKHKIAIRKVLNEEQRVMFDMRTLKKAYRGNKRGDSGHHGYH